MFALAGGLEPDTMREVAERAYAEMARAGYGAVGEFHYVHHQPDGRPYAEPNAMAFALAEAASAVGLRIVLLPAAYHRNGWDRGDREPEPGQRRFCDPDVDTFLDRVDALASWARSRPGVEVGIAAHSVRAVPADWLEAIGEFARSRGMVHHVHAHEQPRELAECAAEHGCTPIELLEARGFLGATTTIVHGTHVSDRDIAILAQTATIVAACPTTEGNLGDGFIPAMRYQDAAVRLAVGSDSNVRIDPFEEARELETTARRQALSRSALLARSGDLWGALHRAGLASLGLASSGGVRIDVDHPDLRGVAPEDLRYALATCASAGVVTELVPGELAGV